MLGGKRLIPASVQSGTNDSHFGSIESENKRIEPESIDDSMKISGTKVIASKQNIKDLIRSMNIKKAT